MNTQNSTPGEFEYDADEVEAAESLLKLWTSEETPEEEGKEKQKPESVKEDQEQEESEESEETPDEEEEAEEADDSDGEEETEEESEEKDEEKTEEESEEESEDLLEKEVEVKVKDEVKKFKIKDLTRLAGQEAAITKKSQEVSEVKKTVESHAAKQAMMIDAFMQRAQERWKPFAEIDMMVAANELAPESFAKLRKEANEAWDELQFVSQEAERFYEHQQAIHAESIKEKAAQAVEMLSDPEKGIQGWSEETYDQIVDYAVAQGFQREAVSRIVDPVALKMIHKARMFDEMQKASKKLKPVNKTTPKKIVKPSQDAPKAMKSHSTEKAQQRFQKSGDEEDAVAALLAKWGE